VITPATLGAIVASAPDGAPRRLARELVAIALACASLAMVPSEAAAPRARRVFRALDAIDDLEDLATRMTKGKVPLRCWRALLTLRAMVARGRPVTHDRVSHYLTDDETEAEPQWWPVGPRVAANDCNEAKGMVSR
jgi:hypothetical protein